MKSFAVIAAVVGLAAAEGHAASSGWGKPVYVTDVVTAYTTYCPSATKITHGASTYTVTEATTLTISDCPCTITRPVSSTGAVATPVPSKSAVGSVAPPKVSAGPSASASAASSYYASVKPSASASGSAPSTTYTGAASKAQVAGGMLAALGLVAAAL